MSTPRTTAEQRLERAIRSLPADGRDRFGPQWRADFAAADDGSADEVSRAAAAMARRLRLRRAGEILTGSRGALTAAGVWLAIAVVVVMAGLLGSVVGVVALALLLLAGLALWSVGAPSAVSHWLMVGSLVVGVCSASFVWWAFGVSIDAADNLTDPPAAAGLLGAAAILWALSVLVFIVSAIAAARRESAIRQHRGRGAGRLRPRSSLSWLARGQRGRGPLAPSPAE